MSCLIREWDSRAKDQHWKITKWSKRSQLILESKILSMNFIKKGKCLTVSVHIRGYGKEIPKEMEQKFDGKLLFQVAM